MRTTGTSHRSRAPGLARRGRPAARPRRRRASGHDRPAGRRHLSAHHDDPHRLGPGHAALGVGSARLGRARRRLRRRRSHLGGGQGRPRVSTVLPCYTGGIDVHAGRSWEVRLNRFTGIYCADGLAEHAVHFWAGSRGTVVERNTIVDCARGIGLGLGDRGHVGGIVRNNVVVATKPVLDTGIGLENASGARVLHNTVWVARAAERAHYSSIDVRFAGTSADVRNNLTRRITVRDGGHARLAGNAERVPGSWFVAPTRGDLHLRAGVGAVNRGQRLPGAGLDLDGERHDAGRPDLGADELRVY